MSPSVPVPTVVSVVRSHVGGLVFCCVLAIIGAAFGLAPYVAVYLTVLTLFGDGSGTGASLALPPTLIGIGVAVAVAIRAVAAGWSTHAAHRTAYRILAELRMALIAQVRRIPIGTVRSRSEGTWKKILHDDVERLEEALAHGIPEAAAAASVPIATTVLLFVVDWRLALGALVSLVLLVVVSGVAMRYSSGANAEVSEQRAVVTREVMSYLRGIRIIRAFVRPEVGHRALREEIAAQAELEDRAQRGRTAWLVSVMGAATSITTAILVPFAGAMFAGGGIGLGTLALFLLIGLAYLGPIMRLVGAVATVAVQLRMAAGAVDEILAESPLPEPARPRTPQTFDLELENVTFGYDPDRPVIDDVSLTVPAGSTLALVGATGAGKSTIAQLISRFWDVQQGAVRIGGVDVREIPGAELATLIAYVQQDDVIFEGTLLENVQLARPEASREQSVVAARAARLGEVADALPDGWDAPLPAGGGTLSGGERQRVSIARALLKQAPVVVLDEATAALDADTERETLSALAELGRGRTMIAIAHRLSTITGADEIALVDGGRIRAHGSHEELLAAEPRYRSLWDAYTRADGWRLVSEDDAPALPDPGVPADAALPDAPLEDLPSAAPTPAELEPIVQADVARLGFLAQWRVLLGRGWRQLVRRGLPALLVDGLTRGVPLVAVYIVLAAAVGGRLTSGVVVGSTVLVVLGLLARVAAGAWSNRTVWSISTDAKADLQLSLVDRVFRVPLGFFDHQDPARLTTLVTNEAKSLDFQNLPGMLISALVQPLVAVVVLVVIDWRLALAALCGLPVFAVLSVWADRLDRRTHGDLIVARGEATATMLEQVRGVTTLRANPGSAVALRYGPAVERLERASVASSVRATPATSLAAISVELGLAVLIVLGGALYSQGTVSARSLLLFLVVALALYQPIEDVGLTASLRRRQQQIAERLAEVWQAEPLPEPAVPATPTGARVTFEGVDFQYPGGAGVHGLTFALEPGTVTALVGPSGAGKTTIARLAARSYDPDGGRVSIGGVDLRDLGTAQVLRAVTTVDQEPVLLGGTVRSNLVLGRPGASEEQIAAALEAARCTDLVAELPDGLDTWTEDNGSRLSGGQRSRLTIARALLTDTPILVLDEAASAIDPETEAQLQDAIAVLAAGRTVLVVAHRLSTIVSADRIVVLSAAGEIEAQGRHEELLQISPTYKRLWNGGR
jgi:ATP-binding cassette subfamily B protein